MVPLAATAFASSGLQFSHFYGLSLALSVLNLIVLLNAFRFSYRIPHVEPVAEEAYSSDEEIEMGAMGGAVDAKDASVEQSGSATPASVIPALPKKKRSTLMLTLTNRTVLISALFIFVSAVALLSALKVSRCYTLTLSPPPLVLRGIGGQHGRMGRHVFADRA